MTIGKWLRAMIEHEVHHRGQIYLMLSVLKVPTPPIFGLTSEELRRRASGTTRIHAAVDEKRAVRRLVRKSGVSARTR